MQIGSILLASHGTPGARAAEALAFALCRSGTLLHHLWVVPDLWRGMMGDDWLNNAATRIAFGEYLEGELSREIRDRQERIAEAALGLGAIYRPSLRLGDPAVCLLALAREIPCDLVVIGAPRARGVAGLRSRLALEPLVRDLRVPLLVAPRPA